MKAEHNSLSNLLGPWIEPNWESGLITRCRDAWHKPIQNLSREELAVLLRQKIAVEHLLPIAKGKLQQTDDGTEIFDGELAEAIEGAVRTI
ncbi:MAG TPA: contact-dependent growth inhibition system immunity protein [Pseudomonadales bacterium]|nr:contact-dependent growth inhibition system immunity protein [Pseudomonadales bacterium]